MSFLTRIKIAGIAGMAATAMTLGTAFAASITATIVPDPTAANVPFSLINVGSGSTNGLVSQAAFTSGGIGFSFSGNSGVYGGDVSGVTRSPFRTSGGGADNLYYLNSQANSGAVTLDYSALGLQTAFNLLWGSVDPSPVTYNQLTFTFIGGGASTTVTGADVVAGLSGVVAGTTNLAVSITGLSFDKIVVTASNQAFEFAVGTAVPEPASMALLGAGLVGLGLAARRRRTAAAAA